MSLLSTPFVGGTTDTVMHCIAFFLLVGGIGFSAWIFWILHELPIKKAKKTNKNHKIEIVTILTWIGFFTHWVWVLAVIIAFTDFEKTIKGIRKIWQDTNPEEITSKEGNNK